MPAPIEDYALLGNCRSAALVSRDGSLDWLCLPRFDAPAVFAALLGNEENGRWRLAPSDPVEATQRRYLDDTLVLETTYITATGRARVIDCMPLGEHNAVVRIVEGLAGETAFEMDLVLRFDYGRSVPWVEKLDPLTLSAVAGPDRLILRSTEAVHSRDHHSVSRFRVCAGERQVFSLRHQPSHLPPQPDFDIDQALERSISQWQAFAARCPDVGPWTPLVRRSLLTLKALTYAPTGGIVAAATTSLPERVGGERNWDYRYCWLRDATMTLLALMNLGYFDEAQAWREWLLRSVAGNPEQMQIMYGLAGERDLHEFTLPWLAGYEHSQPVRVGNAAAQQLQLDIYGELADAMTQAIRGGLPRHPRSSAIARLILPYLEKIWREPDEGIWEVRGGRQHFVHSKVMAWVAFDRAASLSDTTEEDRERGRHYRQVADEIHRDVCQQGLDPSRQCFVQAYGSSEVDASLLQIALTGFLPADDPRFLRTLEQIERRLLRNGLLLRYDSDLCSDGLTPGEGTFLVCSFWLADVYVLLGRHAQAQALYERLTGLCNDVGLLAEQYDPLGKRMLGNFPQAFSHIGIINTALNLHRAQCPVRDRASCG
ncbi:glycoside hydrolase family 15 protein [Pseudomonas guariconensis]|uniref:glycoside hydrolase family 15 protein n=1 Tax=Pseudomonas TaxID=286 RepID=UPI001CE3D3F9|nr:MULTISPECIES: glycoside hydrolase family 15 protein [Pseudomonas]MCO7637661.1 glycoside hydrolase family 15 protein [Pseudomonas sp. S 311-6]MCO7517160.1 glycoside hydrolase family 15 protein [Pseudomonas putida]MCO7567111.1 glycoside hydrolase family 15 protein [Pseudomonas mosselii]MCO7607751.1 glycoside hydrolase family 15 protein [Pseudomonas guariconensis]MCO7618670.1 glycoside hydrolase family 15 protein [Pseudomonas guariconensis]